ncbi:MAG: hypothetical protein ACREFO_18695 [Acetobacteraceae bacterium]
MRLETGAEVNGPGTAIARQHLLFSRDEFAERLAALRREMSALGVDLAIFDEIEAMTWISGYGNSAGAGSASLDTCSLI